MKTKYLFITALSFGAIVEGNLSMAAQSFDGLPHPQLSCVNAKKIRSDRPLYDWIRIRSAVAFDPGGKSLLLDARAKGYKFATAKTPLQAKRSYPVSQALKKTHVTYSGVFDTDDSEDCRLALTLPKNLEQLAGAISDPFKAQLLIWCSEEEDENPEIDLTCTLRD